MPIQTRSSTRNAKERILDAAAKVLAEHGYQSANVDDIISLSGTSKGSFYFHFPSKEKMVLALVDQLSQKLIDKIEESLEQERRPLHRIALAIDTLLQTFSGRRALARMLLVNLVGQGKAMDKKFLPVRDRFAALIQRELDRAVEAGVVPRLDTRLAAQVWLGALNEVILRWLHARHPEPMVQTTPALREMLLRSVGADVQVLRQEAIRP
jgi:AcrR family transcriptional regulator